MFRNKRYTTKGITGDVPVMIQILLWNLIDTMNVSEKDYLQVFNLSEENSRQKIVHTQEVPEYKKEYLISLSDTPVFCGKIFVMDENEYSIITIHNLRAVKMHKIIS